MKKAESTSEEKHKDYFGKFRTYTPSNDEILEDNKYDYTKAKESLTELNEAINGG